MDFLVLVTPSDVERSAAFAAAVDSPAGLVASLVFAPVYLYASMKGKFDFWRNLLEEVMLRPKDPTEGSPALDLSLPTLDAGCGRGMALVQAAKTRAQLAGTKGVAVGQLAKSVGIDLFITADQTGNSVDATCSNLVAEGVADNTELYKASFVSLPFEDNTFGLVTSSLARECARVRASQRLAHDGVLPHPQRSPQPQVAARPTQGRRGAWARAQAWRHLAHLGPRRLRRKLQRSRQGSNGLEGCQDDVGWHGHDVWVVAYVCVEGDEAHDGLNNHLHSSGDPYTIATHDSPTAPQD